MALEWMQPYLAQVQKFEGFNPRAYWDYKQHSIGYGSRARHPGETITRAEAEQRLLQEMEPAAALVDRFAPNLPEGWRAALTSLTYNAGSAWQQAGLGAALRAGDYDKARRLFAQYNKAGGETLPGLVSRRQAELAWIDKTPTQTRVPVPTAPTPRNMMAAAPTTPRDVPTPEAPQVNALMAARAQPQANPWDDIGNALINMQQPRRPAPNMSLATAYGGGGNFRGYLPGRSYG